ncbi:MAG: c-type cytochrome [Chloroflexota bacterium]
MRQKENYSSQITVALGLTLAIIATFQAYILREPARIQADIQAEHEISLAAGKGLYAGNCISCHGADGKGDLGPALNSKSLLDKTSDKSLFNLVQTGIPGTIMPAWGQIVGGPFTDEEISNLVVFIRAWEETAIDPILVENIPNPARGAAIFTFTCIVCHGDNGKGSELAPAINDLARLEKLDDEWYRQTITQGRPAKGMPTWGSVLSPDQVNDLVALISAWREGRDIIAEIPFTRYISNALYAIREFDRVDAEFFLTASLKVADNSVVSDIKEVISLVEENRLFEAEAALISLLPSEEKGWAIFEANCSSCHADDGTGRVGPNLHNNVYIQSLNDEDLINFILTGRAGTAMPGFEGSMFEDDILNLIFLLQSWQ